MVEIILLATIKPAQATQKVLTCIYMYMYSIFDYFSVKLAINDKYSILVFVCFFIFFCDFTKRKIDQRKILVYKAFCRHFFSYEQISGFGKIKCKIFLALFSDIIVYTTKIVLEHVLLLICRTLSSKGQLCDI